MAMDNLGEEEENHRQKKSSQPHEVMLLFSGSQFTSYNFTSYNLHITSYYIKLSSVAQTSFHSCQLLCFRWFLLQLKKHAWGVNVREPVTNEDKILLFCFLHRHYKHALFLPAGQELFCFLVKHFTQLCS